MLSHSKITSSVFLLMDQRYKDEVEIMFHVIHFKKAVTYIISFRGISFKIDEISFRYLKILCTISFPDYDAECMSYYYLLISLTSLFTISYPTSFQKKHTQCHSKPLVEQGVKPHFFFIFHSLIQTLM